MTPENNEINFNPTIKEFITQRANKKITVLSGANNSGKSLILKLWAGNSDNTSYIVGSNRFYNIHSIQSDGNQSINLQLYKNNYKDSLNYTINEESNYLQLQNIITTLSNDKRESLFDICYQLLGIQISVKHSNPQNCFSNRYIDIDGQNLSLSSSGTRLLITLLGISLNEEIASLFIDEPELGLSPTLQAKISDYFLNSAYQKKYFPHLKQIVIATHSHLFLDRNDTSNNFTVSKEGQNIKIHQIETIIDFHRLQFNMLGNTFESIFLPSAIVIVEGETDLMYLDKVIRLRLSDKRISVIPAKDDSRTTEVVNHLKNIFGDLQESPFRDRIFVVLDKTHSQGLKAKLEKGGVLTENIIIWEKNGIEYVYPNAIMAEIYHCNEETLSKLNMVGDVLELNGINNTKKDLAAKVVQKLTKETILPEELKDKLLNPLDEKLR